MEARRGVVFRTCDTPERRRSRVAVVAAAVLLGLAAGVALRADAAAAARREARALNNRLHHWLVESGAMCCDYCGPPRTLEVWRLLRGW